ncbi:MAG: isocitrate dehydrogenase kinase/phosphatase AceK regulatory subunit, partial [Gammaproteobacteria bacterium]
MDGGSPAAMAQDLACRTAAGIFAAFEDYNHTFRTITRRAERRFVEREWQLGQRDAVERIELYDRRVEKCLADLVGHLGRHIAEETMWREIKTEFASLIATCPDRKFDATFFNSLTRKVFKTVGVNRDVEFSTVADEQGESHSAPLPGDLPLRTSRRGTDLLPAVEHVLAGVPWARNHADPSASARFIVEEIDAVVKARSLTKQGLHI